MIDARWHTPLTLGAFGLVFVSVAVLLAPSIRGATDHTMADVPAADAAALRGVAVGTRVLVDGRIAAGTPIVAEGLVALERQQAAGVTRPGSNDVRFTWEARERISPPMVIETATGSVQVRNADYELREPPHQQPAQMGTVTAGTERRVGFKPGDLVTVQGDVAASDGAGAVALVARVLRGGDRGAFVRAEQASAMVPTVLAAVFGLVGLGALWAAVRGGLAARAG